MAEITDRGTPSTIRSGQTYDQHKQISIPYIEFETPYSVNGSGDKVTGYEGMTGVEQIPKDGNQATVRIYDIAAINAALASIYFEWSDLGDVDLPDVLTGVEINFNSSVGDGASSHPASNQGAGSAGSGSSTLNPKASAEGSASVIPDIQPIILPCSTWGRGVPRKNYVFYIASPASQSDILTRLSVLAGATVLAKPLWKKKSHVITAFGQQVSIQINADTTATVSASESAASYAYEWGNGYSSQSGVSVRTVDIPPTIHGDIDFSADSYHGAIVFASAQADTINLYIGASIIIPAITNEPSSIFATAAGTVFPDTLAATSPASIPSSGLYMVELTPQIDDNGLMMIHAAVVDFSIFA